MTSLLDALRQGWSWTGIDFAEITAISKMGQLIVTDTAGTFYHLDPEVRQLVRIGSDAEIPAYFANPEVELIWRAEALVEAARQRLGELPEGYVYTLKPQALVAGDYAHENLCMLPVAELISFAGDFERQTKDWPDGTRFQFKVTD